MKPLSEYIKSGLGPFSPNPDEWTLEQRLGLEWAKQAFELESSLAEARREIGECSVCGTSPALLVDKKHKGTYWKCAGCMMETIEDKMKLEAENERLREVLVKWRQWCDKENRRPCLATDRHYMLYSLTGDALKGNEDVAW